MCGYSSPEGITREREGTPRVPGCTTLPPHTAKAASNTSVYEGPGSLQDTRRNCHRAHAPTKHFSGTSYLIPRTTGKVPLLPRPEPSLKVYFFLLLSSLPVTGLREQLRMRGGGESLCLSDIWGTALRNTWSSLEGDEATDWTEVVSLPLFAETAKKERKR